MPKDTRFADTDQIRFFGKEDAPIHCSSTCKQYNGTYINMQGSLQSPQEVRKNKASRNNAKKEKVDYSKTFYHIPSP